MPSIALPLPDGTADVERRTKDDKERQRGGGRERKKDKGREREGENVTEAAKRSKKPLSLRK